LEAAQSHEIVVLGMRLENPFGYGRLITDGNGRLGEIIEERDATPEQKAIDLCNSGIMAVSGDRLFTLLEKLTPNNNAGEYYLTDIVALANDMGLHCQVVEAPDANELGGINTRAQLASAENVLQNKLRAQMMENGVTLIDPQSAYFRVDTKIAPDVVIHPQVVFGANVEVESNVEIRSFCHIEGAYIKEGAIIGPFARIRPSSTIGKDAHIGNFVEVKNTVLGDGAKANHLSYVGDSEVGAAANIGAGTITCNYDGVNKHKTIIGAKASIGSNSSLVAPVTIGEGAVTGAGSVITEDVPKDALAFGRARQVNKEKRAKK
jgi:bifunctional UDP-N-acetylglucosamine pyrophosphorylase/glucosamine-1-phosphate N-acetyltransferase